MIFSWLIVWGSLFQINLIDYQEAFLRANNPVLSVELVAEKDTVAYSEPINIVINLENISDKTVYIPHNFSVVSNLLPNGLSDKIYDGGIIQFDIQPVSECTKLFTENVVVSEPQEFIKLKSGQSYEFKYNIGLHLQAINDWKDEDDCLSIRMGKTYRIKARYENVWEYKKRKNQSFIGIVQSNEITIFLKKD
jgi:hypothetical protein